MLLLSRVRPSLELLWMSAIFAIKRDIERMRAWSFCSQRDAVLLPWLLCHPLEVRIRLAFSPFFSSYLRGCFTSIVWAVRGYHSRNHPQASVVPTIYMVLIPQVSHLPHDFLILILPIIWLPLSHSITLCFHVSPICIATVNGFPLHVDSIGFVLCSASLFCFSCLFSMFLNYL